MLSRRHIGALGVTLVAFALPFGIPFFGIGVGNGGTNTPQGNTVISIEPKLTCIPRPPCLDSVPRCEIVEPDQGWCPPGNTPPITATASVTPPQGCHYIFPMCAFNCTASSCPSCKPILVCPSGSPIPEPTCVPEPYCLRHAPFCYPPVPLGGWCPTTSTSPSPIISLPPSPTPHSGCYYQKQVCPLLCPINNPNCCDQFPEKLVCPSGTPIPHPSCIQEPPCLRNAPYCLLRVPVGQFCPPTVTPRITITGFPCLPKPSCLNASNPCRIPEPQGGWCPTITASISSVPVSNTQGTNPLVIIWKTIASFFHF